MQRGWWLGAAGAVAVVAIAAAVGFYYPRLGVAPKAVSPKAPAASAAATAPPHAAPATPTPAPSPPSFDIVKVDPNGHAVIAGRASPGAQVQVLADGTSIGAVTADANGEWVLMPDSALAPGDHQLSLEATDPLSGARRFSADTVAVEVAAAARPGTTVAVLVPGNGKGATRVLQQPGGAPQPGSLSIDTAEYDGHGHLALAGHAAPGAAVHVYANAAELGTATADARGDWSLQAPLAAPGKSIELRAETAATNGAVAQLVKAPFAAPGAVAVPAGERYVVRPGNNLWLLAQHAYGEGVRYTIIYQANRGSIRDPNLIYPGQVFILPKS